MNITMGSNGYNLGIRHSAGAWAHFAIEVVGQLNVIIFGGQKYHLYYGYEAIKDLLISTSIIIHTVLHVLSA